MRKIYDERRGCAGAWLIETPFDRNCLMPRGVTSLSREQIVSAAVELAEDVGLDRVTMRGLAASLGVGAMSIYYHLRDKHSLLEAVADSLWSKVPAPDSRIAWQTRMRMIAAALRSVARRHPSLVPLLLTRRRSGPEGLRPVESLLCAARDAGYDPPGSVRCFRVLVGYVVGFAQAEAYRAGIGLRGTRRWLATPAAAARFPNLRDALAASRGRRAADREFDFGLELLLAGFRSTALRVRGARFSSKRT